MQAKNVGDLKGAPYNPRKISQKQFDALGQSIKEFGDLSGIIFNINTGRICGGHQRLKHLDISWEIEKNLHKDKTGTVALGHIQTPFGRWQYREVDWPEQKELAANIAANKHGGAWDYPKLKDLLVHLDDGDFSLGLTGFDEAELKRLIDHEPEKIEDEATEGVGTVKTCPNCGVTI